MTDTIAIKERPILFSGEMVRAILDGRKTKTRRVVKPQPSDVDRLEYYHDQMQTPRDGWVAFFGEEDDMQIINCPYGQPGDRLWVRETWQLLVPTTVCWGPGEDEWDWDAEEYGGKPSSAPREIGTLCYRADDENACKWWRPSIFMPRWASRINLEIATVKVERLQDISEKDAYAEGIDLAPTMPHPIDWFRTLWDQINGKRGYGWNVNPWVWLIEFRQV